MFSEVLAFLCTQPPLRIRLLLKIQTVPLTACADSPRSSAPASPSESATSDSPNRPGFGTFRRFPALAFGPSQRSSCFQTSAPSGDSSGTLLPSRRTSAPSATTSGRPSPLTGDSFGFFRQDFGSFRLQEPKREGGRRRGGSGERKWGRVASQLSAPDSPGGERGGKEGPALRRA